MEWMEILKRTHLNLKNICIVICICIVRSRISHPLFHVISKFLVAFDEYSVENFHHFLRSITKITDSGSQICLEAREIVACKHELHEFKSWFVPQRQYNFCASKVEKLKFKAEYLMSKFKTLLTSTEKAKKLPRTSHQPKDITNWILPNLLGENEVTIKVLLLAFSSPENSDPDGYICSNDKFYLSFFQSYLYNFTGKIERRTIP